jgi:hypothetical protein
MGKSIDLAAKPEKITDEQLKEVQQVISTSNQIKLEVGNEINSTLEKEYGKMDIDINTGAINYPEDEQANS